MFKSNSELEAGMAHIRQSPTDHGVVEKIVCRPAINERRELAEAQLDTEAGLVGDNWLARGYRKTPDGRAHPDMQLNLMNARAIALIAGSEKRWQLAGDQFFIDLDLSPENLPPGMQLQIGDAIIEVTAEPHTGCSKFMERFGRDAAVFVNSKTGRAVNMRGINARVIQSGAVRTGSRVYKLPPVMTGQ
jgi:MOSC domain-containing protein YiiM